MGEFDSDDNYSYYCGQESLRRNGVALLVNKKVQSAVLGCSLKNNRMISVYFEGKPFSIRVIQVYAPATNAKEAECFCEDLQDLLEWTPRKDVLFITGDWNAKIGSQEIPGVTGKFVLGIQHEAGQRLIEFRQCTGHRKYPLQTTQEMTVHMGITRRSILTSDWLYSLQPKMKKLYTVWKNKTGSWLWLRSWTPYCKIQT